MLTETPKVRLDQSSIDMLKKLTTPKRPNFFSDRVKDFETSFRENIELVEKSLNESNFEQVKFFAHKYKTAAGVMGATSISNYCHKVEELVKKKPEGYQREVRLMLRNIVEESKATIVELNSLI
ncbi:Hpt domain-containing protein [bacterium]|nr:Hpt domain-containing protein [bacterium]